MGNKFMRRMVTLLVAAAMIMTSGVFAFAAESPTTGKVTSVKSVGVTSGKSLTISWKVDNQADKYIVKVGSKTYETTSTSLKVTTTPGKTYKITVTPVYGEKKGTAKTATSRWAKSTKITKATKTLSKKVKLTWKKVSGATKYQVMQYKNGKWTIVKIVKGTSATIKVGKKGSYKFRVRPVKGSYVGVESKSKTGKAK